METRKKPFAETVTASPALAALIAARSLDDAAWVGAYGSGTLKYAREAGVSWRQMYLAERCAWEFGHGFELVPRSRVEFGDALADGDCPAFTETLWHFRRQRDTRLLPGERIELKSLVVSGEDGPRRGLAIVLRDVCAPWLPGGHLGFALVAVVGTDGKYGHAINPL